MKGFSHSFIPRGTLEGLETIHIDLAKDENVLLMEMHKSTRKQVRNAKEKEFEQFVIETPTDQDFKEFQYFYNRFAKNKHAHTCSSFHIKTMKLLREKNAIMLTYMQDKQKNILCYRIYITDGDVVMNLYSASHYRMSEDKEKKRMISQANRLLIWNSILWFKEKGYKLYDMGGLTSDDNIRLFKLGFGGKIVPVYSGYEAHSFWGQLIIKVRNLKMTIVGMKV
ncbi:hypothetical protein [Sporosarcina sp. YIM B06819]|uniref:hypothetical protein n=1 Tax=Sporosarcina sp. YIM B06819 TaxID=3081769 RepID=UPI00298D56C8|nr:hypothetical protein [Sporosarcina sp. YIM B06819]